MVKYIIEGDENFDFFTELKKSINEENIIIEETNNNVCLITGEKLVDCFVELECGHKFNYIPLYNDLYNYKKKFMNMESNKQKLNYTEIRCPYCRNIQKHLLPFVNMAGVEKIHGINFIDENKIFNENNTSCTHSYGYKYYNYTLKYYTDKQCFYEIEINAGIKYKCSKHGYLTVLSDGNYYCKQHCKKADKIIINKKKLEEKEALKKKKLEEKEELKKKKLEEKEALKKKKTKKNTQEIVIGTEPGIIIPDENIIVTPVNGCKAILKSGVNKGKLCGCKIFNYVNDTIALCKRHYS